MSGTSGPRGNTAGGPGGGGIAANQPGTYDPGILIIGPGLTLSPDGTLSAAGGAGLGSVTQVSTGAGLAGGPIVGAGTLTLNVATTGALGGVIVGTGLNVASGTLSNPGVLGVFNGVTTATGTLTVGAGLVLAGNTLTGTPVVAGAGVTVTSGTIANTGVLAATDGTLTASGTLHIGTGITLAAGGTLTAAPGGGTSVLNPGSANVVSTMAGSDYIYVYTVGGGQEWINRNNFINSSGETMPAANAAASAGTDTMWVNQGGTTLVVATMAGMATYFGSVISGGTGGSVVNPGTGNTSNTMTASDYIYIFRSGVQEWISRDDFINNAGETMPAVNAAPSAGTDTQWVNQGGTALVVLSMSNMATYYASVIGSAVVAPGTINTTASMTGSEFIYIYRAGGEEWISRDNFINGSGETIPAVNAAAASGSDTMWVNQGGTSMVVQSMSATEAYIAATLPPREAGMSVALDGTLTAGTYDLGVFTQGGTVLNGYAHVVSGGTMTYGGAIGAPGTYTNITGLTALAISTNAENIGTASAANVIPAGQHLWLKVTNSATSVVGGSAIFTVKVP